MCQVRPIDSIVYGVDVRFSLASPAAHATVIANTAARGIRRPWRRDGIAAISQSPFDDAHRKRLKRFAGFLGLDYSKVQPKTRRRAA